MESKPQQQGLLTGWLGVGSTRYYILQGELGMLQKIPKKSRKLAGLLFVPFIVVG